MPEARGPESPGGAAEAQKPPVGTGVGPEFFAFRFPPRQRRCHGAGSLAAVWPSEEGLDMARDAYLEHLAAVPLFAKCNRKQLGEIGRVADEVTIPAGTTFVKQGAIGVELFIIVDGTASVTRDGESIATLGQGDFVGELAVLAHHGRRNATVTADTEVTVLVLTASGLEQLLDDIPGLAKALLREVVSRVPDADVRS